LTRSTLVQKPTALCTGARATYAKIPHLLEGGGELHCAPLNGDFAGAVFFFQ